MPTALVCSTYPPKRRCLFLARYLDKVFVFAVVVMLVQVQSNL
jgi:hypothetical protein